MSGPHLANSILVAEFRSALIHQGLLALLVLVCLAIVWAGVREWLPSVARRGRREAEPAGRCLLRVGFGVLWVFDGVLQAQPAMPAGLSSQVLARAADGSPGWVRHLVNWAGTAWSHHPVQSGAAAVWIQVGVGIWLLAAARGRWSRLAGLASAGWGLVVWVFGEAFGGILGPGQSLLFGTPGAAACYCVAGCLIALPGAAWASAALGRRLLTGLGVFFAGMAVLQATPTQPGSMRQMLASMSGVPQPAPLAHLISAFSSLVASHGSLLNAIASLTLGILGLGLVASRRRLLAVVVIAVVIFCLADWVLVQDLGFLGGLGTDPNSMVPLILLVVAGYLGATWVATAPPPAFEPAPPVSGAGARWRTELRPVRLAARLASTSATEILASWAALLMLFGAAPLALVTARSH